MTETTNGKPQRMILVEENLPIQGGHWQHYMEGLAKGFSACGYSVECLGSGPGSLSAEVPIQKVFRNSIWSNPYKHLAGPLRFFLKLFHFWAWARDLRNWTKVSLQKGDILFAPNQRPVHLLAWGLWLVWSCADEIKILLGMNYFGEGRERRITLLNAVHLKLARVLLRRATNRNQVIFFSENQVARKWLESQTGFRFQMMPHNVDTSISGLSSSEEEGGPECVFVSLGFARFDKGSDLILQAIEVYLRDAGESSKVKFWLQWGQEVPRSEFFEHHPNVTFCDDLLDSKSIESILKKADCALMPYRNEAYFGRLSRAAIDAVVCGCPVIYPEGSSLDEIIQPFGVGLCFEDGSVDSFRHAINEVVHNRTTLKKAAVQKSFSSRVHFSPHNHARVILDVINVS